MQETDEHWMQLALESAALGFGRTSPNPMVGAVLVGADGRLLGRGAHLQAGGPHAEIAALADVSPADQRFVAGSTLFVTLEPCCTHGRTAPCTDAIIAARISRVVYAMQDPNPAHAGKAEQILKNAGISVTTGTCGDEARTLLKPWTHFITTGRPYILAKAGMSVDGRIARRTGEGQWLTNEQSRHDAMQLRVAADAILVGAETIRQDDPALTVRGPASSWKEQPWRVILTRSGNLPEDSQVLTDAHKERTILWPGKNLRQVVAELGKLGVVNLLLEGGGQIFAQAFADDLVNEFHVYIAPMICGTGKLMVDTAAFAGAGTAPLSWRETKMIGTDVKLVYERA